MLRLLWMDRMRGAAIIAVVVPLVVGAALVRACRHPVVDGLFAA